jgi:hypothetical protein
MMRDGTLWEHPTLAQTTEENACGLWPTPSYNPPGWKNIQVVDKNGKPPRHWNQRFYNKKTGRLVQKGLEQVVTMWPTPSATEC